MMMMEPDFEEAQKERLTEIRSAERAIQEWRKDYHQERTA